MITLLCGMLVDDVKSVIAFRQDVRLVKLSEDAQLRQLLTGGCHRFFRCLFRQCFFLRHCFLIRSRCGQYRWGTRFLCGPLDRLLLTLIFFPHFVL